MDNFISKNTTLDNWSRLLGIPNRKEKAMTFDEFVEALLKAGWIARNDAQHAHIRELWDDLCFKGLNIPMPNATPHGRDERSVP